MSIITLRLRNINKARNVDHIYTNWEISTAKNFDRSRLVYANYEDRWNKASLLIDSQNPGVDHEGKEREKFELTPGTRYYARAQIVTNKGAHEWSNLQTWIHKPFDDVDGQSDLPTRISSPDVYTDSDVMSHLPTGFTIYTRDFSCIGEATHIATSYWIETLDGKIIWKNLYNTISLHKILVKDVMLRSNTVYRVKAVFHASSNDTSQVSTKAIFVTPSVNDTNTLRITKILSKFDTTQGDIVIPLYKVPKCKSVEIRIFGYIDGNSELAFETTVDLTKTPAELRLSPDLIKRNNVYLLLIKYDINKVWNHITFNTF